MSNDQPQRPKSLISKLSSRNRRRRRESREEKIPIPSFAFTPSQSNPEQSTAAQNDCGDNESIHKQSRAYGKDVRENGKENTPECQTANINSSFSESKCAKLASDDKQQVNAAVVNCPLSPDMNGQTSLSSSNNIGGTSSHNTLLHKLTEDATLQIEQRSLATSGMPVCHSIFPLSNLNAGGEMKMDTTKNFSSEINNQKRKIDSPPAAAAVAAFNESAGDIMEVEAATDKPLNVEKQKVLAGNQDNRTDELLDNSESNSRQAECHATIHNSSAGNQRLDKQVDFTRHLSDDERVTAPLLKSGELKSRKSVGAKFKGRKNKIESKSIKDCDSTSSDSGVDLKPVKKEAGEKRPKKPTAATISKPEVIDLGSDSDSSSCKPPPKKKRPAPKKTAIKTEKKKFKSETVASAQTNKPSKPIKQSRPTSKSISSDSRKLCYACSTCKCNSRDGTSATPSKQSISLSGSHARQERALINRLQKIERNVQWMESQKHDVGRQLMKQRNIMTKKFEESNQLNSVDRPTFLADMENGGGQSNRELDDSQVVIANIFIFGEEKAKMAPKTLTQHFGCSSKPDSTSNISDESTNEAENNLIIESTRGSILSQIDEEQDIDEDLQQQKVNAHLTSMVDFAEAIACCKETNHLSSWDAATTAPALASRLDEFLLAAPSPSNSSTASRASGGLDELLELFADTPFNLQNDLDVVGGADDVKDIIDPSPSLEPPLTPRGRQISCDIENSLAQEPAKLAAVERVCPEWRDNIRFAQLQTNQEDLNPALGAVRNARSHLKRMKENILQALLDREQTLELFEHSLERSIDRISEKQCP